MVFFVESSPSAASLIAQNLRSLDLQTGFEILQQEVTRVVLESLAISLIDAIGGDGDHPAFLPNGNIVMNFPQPNTDTIYRASRVTPGGTYRLRGQRGSLRLLSMGQVGLLPGGLPGPTRSFFVFSVQARRKVSYKLRCT